MLHSLNRQMVLTQCRCSTSRQRLGSYSLQATAAAAAVPSPRRQHRLSARPAAASAAAADAVTQQLDGIVPYLNKNAAQLRGRHLPSDPIQGAWEVAAKAALRGELLLAAAVDKHKYAPYVMAGLAGVLMGSGLDASTLLRHGLPPYMPDLLLRVFGAWDTSLWGAALTAAALPVTAWALRAWWRANLLLLGGAAGVLQHALQHKQQQSEEGSPPASGGAAAQQQRSQSQAGSIAHLVAAAVAVFRGVCLATAANSAIGLLYTKGATNSMMGLTAATGVAALAAAVASVALLQQRHTQTAPSSSSSSSKAVSTQALLALFGAETAWLAAVAGLGPLVSTAAAVLLAGSLYLLHSSVVAPALLQYRAAAGDVVEVHVGLKLAGTRPVFDSTVSEQPLRVEVGRVPDEVLQLWEAASVDLGSVMQSGQAQQQQHGADSSSSGGSSGGGGEAGSEAGEQQPMVSESLGEVQRDIQGWMDNPSARWDCLRPFVAAASDGLFLGDTVSVPLYNPKVVGFWSPRFTWWQPIAEVTDKFQGNMPGVGDVFWYPVADGAAVPTRVNAVGQDYVELDANWGVTDTELELQVQLVRLQKPQQA